MMDSRWMFGGATVLAAALFAGYGAIGAGPSQSAATGSALAASAPSVQDGPRVTLYKNPTCACCADWAEHMRENGYEVEVKEGADLASVRAEYGVPFSAASCHTAVVDGYALEGHVPADVVAKLLEERPEVTGLAVPGMPRGVPGMPGEGLGSYDVLSFQSDGAPQIYASK